MTTLNTPPPTEDLHGMQDKLRNRLMRLGGRIRAQIVADAGVRGLAIVFALLSMSIILDFWLELSRPIRGIYWLVTLAAGAHLIYHYGVRPLMRKLGPIELAEALDIAKGNKGATQIAPRVATVLQLPEMLGDESALSGQMIQDAVGRSYRSLENTNFVDALNGKHMMQCTLVFLAALAVPGVVGGIMQNVGDNAVNTWVQRWLLFSDEGYTRNTEIQIVGLNEDGTLTVPAGETFNLRAIITTKDGKEIDEARITIEPQQGDDQTLALNTFSASEGDFRIEMAPLTGPTAATVRAGDETLVFQIEPAARPRLTALQLSHTHPADPDTTNVIDFAGVQGEVSILDHNQVQLLLTANVPIAQARYVESEDATDLPPIVRAGENQFMISWEHHEAQRLRIELVSEGAELVSQPIPISVGVKNDRRPSVRLRSTGVGQRITPVALIPLEIEARDDIGLTDVTIQVVRERTGSDSDEPQPDFDPIVLYDDADATRRDHRDNHGLEVEDLGVRPTDLIRVTGVAIDNRYLGSADLEAGGQVGESTTLSFRIVTQRELLSEIIIRQQQARATFRQAIEDSRDVEQALSLAESGNDAVTQARRFRAIQRAVWSVGRDLERSAEEMLLNRLGGTREDGNQTYDLMQQRIIRPLNQLHDQTMTIQRDALEASANANAQQLQQLTADQGEVVQAMTDLLNQMNEWDNLLDTINQLDEVIRHQEQIKERLDELIREQETDVFD